MTPEEFSQSLRGCIRQNFPAYLDLVKNSITTNGELNDGGLRKFLGNTGGILADAGYVPRSQIEQINALVLAIYNSRMLHDYMMTATERFKADEGLQATLKRIFEDFPNMPESEIRRVFDMLLHDDSFATGPIRIMLTDPQIRRALGVPEDLTFERYILDVRKRIREAHSLDEITKVSRIGPGEIMVCNIAVACAVGIVVVATIAAIVHTGAVAVNYVGALVLIKTTVAFTVAGQAAASDRPCPVVPLGEGVAKAICMNESERTVWLVVHGRHCTRRVPLPPGRSSAGMGLDSVAAVLIGGRLNAVDALISERDGYRNFGAYVIAQDCGGGAEVVLREGAGAIEAIPNHVQRDAEARGLAGWSDLQGGGSAALNYSETYRMSDVAAAVPEGVDFVRLIDQALSDSHFYNTLRIVSVAEKFVSGSQPRTSEDDVGH